MQNHDTGHPPGPSGVKHFPHLSHIHTAPRYTQASPAVQRAIDEFFEGKRKAAHREDLYERNHTPYDIGLRLIIAHTRPPRVPMETSYDTTTERSPQDRIMISRCVVLYDAICTQDDDKRHAMLAHIPFEEQSATIQTCKRCITNLYTHPGGRSALLPYFSTNKPDVQLGQIVPPISSIDTLFHDLIVAGIVGEDVTQQLLQHAQHHHLAVFYTGNPIPTETPTGHMGRNTSDSPTTVDPYIQNAFLETTALHTTITNILKNWAVLHHQHQTKLTYTKAGLDTLDTIRNDLVDIHHLLGSVHLHHFVRHLPSRSDHDDSSSVPHEPLQHTPPDIRIASRLPREPTMLITTSSRTYARQTAQAMIDQCREETGLILNYTPVLGLDNHKKSNFFEPTKKVNNENELILFIDYLHFIGVSSVNITHSRVLKRLLSTYQIPADSDTLLKQTPAIITMPIISGQIAEDSSPHPETYVQLAEQVRELIHRHAAQQDICLQQFATPWTTGSPPSTLSINTFLYRLIDILRETHKNHYISFQTLFHEVMQIIGSRHPAIKTFVLDKTHAFIKDADD